MSFLPEKDINKLRTNFYMNNIRTKVQKNLPKKFCDKYDVVEDFINEKNEQICSHEVLSAKEVIQRLCFLVSFLALKQFVGMKY